MKNKTLSVFSSILTVLFYGLFIYAEIVGVYHSFKKHDGWLSIYLPPVAWYHAAEIWWHDDFADVDWNKRIKTDTRIATFLIDKISTNQEDAESIEQLDKFINEIENYPADKQEKIRNNVKLYFLYLKSMTNDIANISNGEIKLSAETNYFSKELANCDLGDKVDLLEKEMQTFTKQLGTRSLTDEEKGSYIEQIQAHLTKFSVAYKRIFKTEIN